MNIKWRPWKSTDTLPQVAIIDDDPEWLQRIEHRYEDERCDTTVFVHPAQDDELLKCAGSFDYILIDHRLGGINGANVARKILAAGVQATIIIIDGGQRDFDHRLLQCYIDKHDLLLAPGQIFALEQKIDALCMETTWLARREPPAESPSYG